MSTAHLGTEGPRNFLTFDEVMTGVVARAALNFPDVTVPLSKIKATPDGLLDVPGVGPLSLTAWSRAQLARLLGIRWDRWFAGSLVSEDERKQEIERRLSRMEGDWKIRSRRYFTHEDGPGQGVLRAFLSPSYRAIDDERIFERLSRVFTFNADAFRFRESTVTDKRSYFVALRGDTFDLKVDNKDEHQLGFLITNSEVGAGALNMLEYLFRQVCTNGLVVPTEGHTLFHRVHRATTDESLDRDLSYALTQLPERWELATQALSSTYDKAVPNPENALKGLLATDPEVRPHTDEVLANFRQEPLSTRFGLIQAITRRARELPPDERYYLERFGGWLLFHWREGGEA